MIDHSMQTVHNPQTVRQAVASSWKRVIVNALTGKVRSKLDSRVLEPGEH